MSTAFQIHEAPLARSGAVILLVALGLAPSCLAHGPWDEKIRVVCGELRRWPDSADLWLRRGDFLSQDGNLHLAADDLRRCAQLQPEHPVLPLVTARLAITAGDFQTAVDALEPVFDPASPDWLPAGLLGQALLGLGDTVRALAVLRSIPRPSPDTVLQVADLLEASGKHAGAVAWIKPHFERTGAVILRIALARSLCLSGKVEEGRELLHEPKAALRVFWLKNEAVILAQAQHEAAATVADQALEEIDRHLASGRLRESSYLRLIRAECHAAAGRWDRAIQSLAAGEHPERLLPWLVADGRADEAAALKRLLDLRNDLDTVEKKRRCVLHEIKIRCLLEREELVK